MKKLFIVAVAAASLSLAGCAGKMADKTYAIEPSPWLTDNLQKLVDREIAAKEAEARLQAARNGAIPVAVPYPRYQQLEK